MTWDSFKGERQVITISQNPSRIASPSGQTLLIRFPTLEKDRIVAPGSVRRLYDLKLASTDVNCKLVTNLGCSIIEKLSVRMQGQYIQSLSSYSDYWGIRDLYLTKAQRITMSRLQQGCEDLALAIVFGKNPS